MQATKPLEKIEQIEKHMADTEVRITRRMEVGQAIQQGDVYVVRVPDDHPRGERLGTQQLAVGSATGARHMIEGGDLFQGSAFPAGMKNEVPDCLGPVVVAPGECTLGHPEHPDHRFPAGTYQTIYQLDHARRRRVAD